MDEKNIRYVFMRPLGINRLVVHPTGSGIIGYTKEEFFEKFKAALTEDVEISVRDLRITFRTIFYPKGYHYHWLDFPIIGGPMHHPIIGVPMHRPMNVYPCDIV